MAEVSSRTLPRVAIVGGGVIGLSIGWRLAQAGCGVDVFERGQAGRGASWAAAGMLAAGVETEPTEESLLPLTLLSRGMWRSFAEDLERAAGMGVGYRDEGTLVVAMTRDQAEQLRSTFELHRRLGLEVEWLSGSAARQREPHLSPRVSAGCVSPKDTQVDNRLVARALIAAFQLAGGQLHEGIAVERIEPGRGVVAEGALHRADVVVLAAGAWSREIAGAPPLPVRPVKGQMLALQMDAASPLLRHVLWAPGAYLAPRRDGRLVVGATVEERGFDGAVTAGAMLSLLDATWRVLPGIEELPIIEIWAGFRPASRDDAPILGPVPGVDGLVLATGHHRNGILLTPVTAEAIARSILEGDAPEAIRPFGIERFRRKET